MKPTKSAKTAVRPRRSAADARTAANKRADELRQRIENASSVRAGTVIGAEDGWTYMVIPKDATGRTKDLSRLDLESKGYERIDDPAITVAGMVDAEIWAVPDEIAGMVKKIKTDGINRRDVSNRRRNIVGR